MQFEFKKMYFLEDKNSKFQFKTVSNGEFQDFLVKLMWVSWKWDKLNSILEILLTQPNYII